jgi:pyruvate dehydrogenase E2 component (dihydrolipoamide acetyltransferase)
MAVEFKLPDIGEGIAEGEIVKWLVQEGQQVKEHQPVVEVMTDKATVEIPAPGAGVIRSLRAKPGDVVPVGSVIYVLDSAASGSAAASAPPASAPQAPAAKTAQATAAKPAAAPAKSAPAAAQAAAPAHAPARASAGGRLEFKLPDIGEGIAEGEIVKWLVQAGDSVKEHQPVVEVMTDKATVEIPAPAAGRVLELRAQAGQVVPIGSVIYVLETSGSAAAPAAHAAPAAPAAAASAPARTPPPARSGAPVHAAPVAGNPSAAAASAIGALAGVARAAARVLAVPSARRVARELGIELAQVSGSGANGVIRRKDVEDFGRSASAAPAASAPARAHAPISLAPGEGETRTPFRGLRRKIAEAMTRSKHTAAHFTVVEELDVTELVRAREAGKAIAAERGVKLTYMPFIMKAVASGLAKHPELNGKLDEASQELVHYGYVNLGIATDTPQGLIVPVIRNVQSKGLLELGRELSELAERTRGGKVAPEDLRGGTFTITNAGNIGGTLATPVINFPEIGILGVHRIVKRPGVVEGPQGDRIEVRQYMNLSISVDHRLVDGANAVRFLVHLKQLLENPGLLAL